MKTISKVGNFFIFLFLALSAISCNRKNDVIPDVTVDFTIDLLDPQFVLPLSSYGGVVTVDNRMNNWRYANGYSGNGIIVARGVDEFYAYDRTCPYEFSLNQSATKINVDAASAKATCPVCGTVYELLMNGQPSSGPGRYYLKNYMTDFRGNSVRVWNNY